MKRRKVPGLTAAFVVTIATGCGAEQEPHRNPPGPDPVTTEVIRMPDGTCAVNVPSNPPFQKPVPCPDGPAATGTFATPPGTPTSTPGLPPAPAGWRIEPNEDGTCTAYGPDPCGHEGCNPPPPQRVACPPNMPKAK